MLSSFDNWSCRCVIWFQIQNVIICLHSDTNRLLIHPNTAEWTHHKLFVSQDSQLQYIWVYCSKLLFSKVCFTSNGADAFLWRNEWNFKIWQCFDFICFSTYWVMLSAEITELTQVHIAWSVYYLNISNFKREC